MVLVNNEEWLNNKDVEQKSPTAAVAAALNQSNSQQETGGIGSVTIGLEGIQGQQQQPQQQQIEQQQQELSTTRTTNKLVGLTAAAAAAVSGGGGKRQEHQQQQQQRQINYNNNNNNRSQNYNNHNKFMMDKKKQQQQQQQQQQSTVNNDEEDNNIISKKPITTTTTSPTANAPSEDGNTVNTTTTTNMPEKHENETREQSESIVIDEEMNKTPILQQQEQQQQQQLQQGSNDFTTLCSNRLEMDNNNLENLEDYTNGPIQVACDSNTNTLQGGIGPGSVAGAGARQMHLIQSQSAGVAAPAAAYNHQQSPHLPLNSILNSNNSNSHPFSQSNANQEIFNSGLNSLIVPPGNAVAHNSASSEIIETNGESKIVLQCEGKSHKFETRSIRLMPNQECKVGRLIAKSKASEGNAIFDCKVLSRNHAMLWYTPDGHFWVKDTKSSNGTFINDNKLGNEPAELHSGDIVKFGVEVIENSRQEVHGCIIARVTLYLPDGREAISIGGQQDQVQLAGPNRISFDEIQRLNAFMQEAAQREKMLKAKLSSLQNVLDSTRKNSAMCWQSMITEDQLLHKINLLEKKLQMVEKNVPENALRNEIVKLLEDKTSYQLTAKEALRKVYQERCDAMQMLTKMEMAYATSENECTILRAQILSSKQTLHDFNARLEQLQLEYMEYKQESLRQQQEAKEAEEQRLQQLKEQLGSYEAESEELRGQIHLLQKSIAERDNEQQQLEQQALERLDAAIADDDLEEEEGEGAGDGAEGEYGDIEEDVSNEGDNESDEDVATALLNEVLKQEKQDAESPNREAAGSPRKAKSAKKKRGAKRSNKDQEEFNLKNKVVRKSTVLKWLKNSDLNKGEGGSDILKAIFNDADSGNEDQEALLLPAADGEADAVAFGEEGDEGEEHDRSEEGEADDEFVHNANGSIANEKDEAEQEVVAAKEKSELKLQTQGTLVAPCHPSDLSPEQTMDMLEAECDFYKQKSADLSTYNKTLQEQMEQLKDQLQSVLTSNSPSKNSWASLDSVESTTNTSTTAATAAAESSEQNALNQSKELDREIAEEMASLNEAAQMEREEELIVYKERLEESESTNLALRNEISQLRLKQQVGQDPIGQQFLIRRALPFGCMALAAIVYFLSSRF